MKRIISITLALILVLSFCGALMMNAYAAEESDSLTASAADAIEEGKDNPISSKAIAAAIVVGIVAAAGAVGMALAISKSVEGMARQPEISGKINSAMMLGLVFIETAIIYALIVAILIIFVL